MENKGFFGRLLSSTKALYISTGTSLGLLSAAGACATGCSLGAFSLSAVLGSVGLGALAIYLPYFKIPLFIVSAILAFLVIRQVNRQGNPTKSSIVGCALGAALLFGGYQIFKGSTCGISGKDILSNFSPTTQTVVRKGIYPLWPKLGRAPTIDEIQKELGYPDTAPVLEAYKELKSVGEQIFYEGTNNIRWLWPLSSIDHGVTVILEGEKAVHARCAVDALGMSQMFGKIAEITAITPLNHEKVTFVVNGKDLKASNEGVLVSEGKDCDDLLFFASSEEFEQYKKTQKKDYLKVMTLRKAFDRGIRVFGNLLEG